MGCMIWRMAIPPSPEVKLAPSRPRRIFLWLAFVGVVAVLPSLVTMMIAYITGSPPAIMSLFAEGDGFLVAIAITADGIGRAVERKKADTVRVIACGAVLGLALIAFVSTKTKLMDHKEAVEHVVNDLADPHHPAHNPERDLKLLSDLLKKVPYSENHVGWVSLYLIGASLFTSFMIVVAD